MATNKAKPLRPIEDPRYYDDTPSLKLDADQKLLLYALDDTPPERVPARLRARYRQLIAEPAPAAKRAPRGSR